MPAGSPILSGVSRRSRLVSCGSACCRLRSRSASRRLSTYQLAQRFEALAVDEAVSEAWALLVSRLRAAGRKVPINDSWIAATAIAHRVPIVAQDSDYDAMLDVQVIKI